MSVNNCIDAEIELCGISNTLNGVNDSYKEIDDILRGIINALGVPREYIDPVCISIKELEDDEWKNPVI